MISRGKAGFKSAFESTPCKPYHILLSQCSVAEMNSGSFYVRIMGLHSIALHSCDMLRWFLSVESSDYIHNVVYHAVEQA